MEMDELKYPNLRNNEKIQNAIKTILVEIGEDPKREGLERTPYRWAKAAEEWFGGYGMKPEDVLNREFTEHSDLVVEGPIKFFSHCEHHMAPFYGEAWIGYIPDKTVTGLDKMVKLVEIYARRLQTQERMTEEIANAMKILKPLGIIVVVKAYHLCVSSRETKNPTTYTTTSALRGLFKTDTKARLEALMLMNMR